MDQAFKDKVKALSAFTAGNFEAGYLLSNGTYSYYQGAEHAPGIDIPQTGLNNLSGFILNHDSDPNMLPVFSPNDILAMYQFVKSGKAGADFFMGLVTNSGTTYLMQISNLTKFLGYFDNYTNMSLFNYTYNIFVRSSNTAEENENQFANYAENFGVTLSRGNAAVDSWIPLGYNGSGGPARQIPCQ